MHIAQIEQKALYRSGFPKAMSRNKYSLGINDRLKRARNRKEISTARVVAELKKKGISIGHSTLQGYEADEKSLNHRYPSLTVMLVLANFYDCSMDFLFGITDEIERPTNDVKDILEKKIAKWNGKKLTKKQRDSISAQIDETLANWA